MAFVRVPALIGKDDASLREVTFLVDSGAFYTILPPSLSADLGIQASLQVPVVLADSRSLQMRLGVAYLRLLDREGGIPLALMEVPEPLLGVSAFEALGLKVNPVEGTLEHARPFGPAVLASGSEAG